MSSLQKNLKYLRPPAVAGSFYPAEPSRLDSLINRLLKEAPPSPTEGRLKILIVPHAGIEYSGAVAAAGFKQIERKDYTRVILLGASHYSGFDFAAVFDQGAWQTPLGKVKVDEGLAGRMMDPENKILAVPEVHAEEHSLELELIFLQKVLTDFEIVPILLGQVFEETLKALSRKIAENLDEETLLLVSSDLSHYPTYEIAEKVDQETIAAILTGDAKTFTSIVSKDLSAGLVTRACGYQAIEVGLRIVQRLDLEGKEIKYENSGGVTGDKKQVVGYGALAFYSKDGKELDSQAQAEALKIARETLKFHLSGLPIAPLSPKSPLLHEPLGAFVTLKENGELRGCIGEFEPREPLYEVIQKMAIAAATEDPRFPKVMKDELPEIKIEISVMTPRQKIDDWRKIRPGVDGVVIQCGRRAGTFLPQVAIETGWSLEEFLSQLCCQKAGLPANCYKSPEVNLYTFQVQILEEE